MLCSLVGGQNPTNLSNAVCDCIEINCLNTSQRAPQHDVNLQLHLPLTPSSALTFQVASQHITCQASSSLLSIQQVVSFNLSIGSKGPVIRVAIADQSSTSHQTCWLCWMLSSAHVLSFLSFHSTIMTTSSTIVYSV